ncbi:MAG: hypothetical protein AAF488_12920 [Planctomycetota bacterium]
MMRSLAIGLCFGLISASFALANDNCLDAILVDEGSYSGSTTGANNDGDASCGNSSGSPDTWYLFVPMESGTLTVSTCGSANFDTVLSIHSDCPGDQTNQINCNDDACSVQSTVTALVTEGASYYVRVSGYNGASGDFMIDFDLDNGSTTGGTSGTTGADVVYTECTSITNWGQSGGVHGYSLGTHTCNIGDANLDWGGGTTPLFGMNAFRLVDGRLEQIGLSWLKNGTIAAVSSGCGLPCNGSGGSVLGAGCRDVYGSSYNGGQSRLGPRSAVNAFTGAYPGQSTGTDPSVINERLQVAQTELATTGALYFIEGVYVAPDDAAAGNAFNNASYKRITVNTSNYDLTPVGTMQIGFGAIYAWADHGLGLNTPDPDVTITEVDVPGEGRFLVGAKAIDLGSGNWRYEYAIYNLSSHRSGGSFSVPLGSGSATNAGFHDVDHHSGEPFDPTDWSIDITANAITWSSPQTFAENENSNALRFGTLYNFWFESTDPPVTDDLTLGLFRPGTPDSVVFNFLAPEAAPLEPEFIRGDCNDDLGFNLADAVTLLTFLFPTGGSPSLACVDACDSNDDGVLDLADAISILDVLFGSATTLPDPTSSCGPDPTADSLDCGSSSSCP